jgi:hypothetical protein
MRAAVKALVVVGVFACGLVSGVAAAQDDPRFRVTSRYMHDGTGARVGVVYMVTNLTDDHICVRPVVRTRENVLRTTPNDVIRLRPRQRNVRLVNFFLRHFREQGVVAATAVWEPDCEVPD